LRSGPHLAHIGAHVTILGESRVKCQFPTAPADLLAAGLTESLGRLAMLAGTALSAPRASVMFADSYFYYRERTAPRLSTDSRARLNKGCAPMSFGRKTS
jgi:hypothetical protein